MTPTDVFAAKGAHDEHGGVGEHADDVAQHAEARSVDPVQVLDREDHRTGLRGMLEQERDRLMELPGIGGRGRGRAERGEEPLERGERRAGEVGHGVGAEVRDERPQRRGDRCVRLADPEIDAATEQHGGVAWADRNSDSSRDLPMPASPSTVAAR